MVFVHEERKKINNAPQDPPSINRRGGRWAGFLILIVGTCGGLEICARIAEVLKVKVGFSEQNQQKIMEENGIWYRYNQQLWWYGWNVWKLLHSNNPKDDSTSVEMAMYITYWLGVIWVSPAATQQEIVGTDFREAATVASEASWTTRTPEECVVLPSGNLSGCYGKYLKIAHL